MLHLRQIYKWSQITVCVCVFIADLCTLRCRPQGEIRLSLCIWFQLSEHGSANIWARHPLMTLHDTHRVRPLECFGDKPNAFCPSYLSITWVEQIVDIFFLVQLDFISSQPFLCSTPLIPPGAWWCEFNVFVPCEVTEWVEGFSIWIHLPRLPKVYPKSH